MPGAAAASDPIPGANESVKAWLARRDITYTVFQAVNLADVPRRVQGPAFAAIWSGQAFGNNQALSPPGQGLTLNLQWQPSPRFYAQAATFPPNSAPGSAPFSGLSFRNWATQLKAGWIRSAQSPPR